MYTLSEYKIIKASGEEEKFSEEKLVRSLATTGMSFEVANQAVNYLRPHIKQGITTHDIFGKVTTYLKENAPLQDYYNYGLKRAIMKLGPSGHPFETLVGDLLEYYGYETQVSVTLGGECITHEIDVIAVKENKTYFIECKYHNAPGTKSDVQVALYTYARFLDIKKAMEALFDKDRIYQPWLMTNTKLTYDAIDYSKCMNIKATSWSSPKEESLHNLIMKSGLHPVTVLDSIPSSQLQSLLERDIVTCFRLNKAIESNSVEDILSVAEINNIKEDIKVICNIYGKHTN